MGCAGYSTKRGAQISPGGSPHAGQTSPNASPHGGHSAQKGWTHQLAATSANGDKPAAPPPPWEGAPATAALFADFLSYRSPRVDGQSRGASEHEAAAAVVAYPALETGGPVAAQAIYSSADFEDKLDLLRARLPGRSSQELRQLLHQADGELHAVLAQVQTPQK